MKLTKRQKEVYNDIKSGAIILTDSENFGAFICFSKEDDREDYQIGSRLFWNMVDKKIIFQEISYPYDYIIHPKFKKLNYDKSG